MVTRGERERQKERHTEREREREREIERAAMKVVFFFLLLPFCPT
jgi:hypothetical protein